MAGFKTEKREVKVMKEVRVCDVGDLSDASKIVYDYAHRGAADFANAYGIKLRSTGFNQEAYTDMRCLVFAAAQKVMRYCAGLTKPEELKARGIEPDVPCAIEPTWTGSDGKTTPLSKMPTPYLQSVRRFAESMTERDDRGKPRGQGLVDAIDAELEKRAEADAA